MEIKNIYIAFDGTEFVSWSDCRVYEDKHKLISAYKTIEDKIGCTRQEIYDTFDMLDIDILKMSFLGKTECTKPITAIAKKILDEIDNKLSYIYDIKTIRLMIECLSMVYEFIGTSNKFLMDIDTKVYKRIREIVSEQLNISEDVITSFADLVKDLKCDELDIIEIRLKIEKEFDIRIKDEETTNLNNIADYSFYVRRQVERSMI